LALGEYIIRSIFTSQSVIWSNPAYFSFLASSPIQKGSGTPLEPIQSKTTRNYLNIARIWLETQHEEVPCCKNPTRCGKQGMTLEEKLEGNKLFDTVPAYDMTREHHIQFSVSAQLHMEEYVILE
jgi:hypothetical protein